jgi:heme-degrading monooxygenase HmoA
MVVALFRSRLRPGENEEYREVATRMLELARAMPGFVNFKSYSAEDGERLAVVEFESLETLEAWRDHREHVEAQSAGRERFYSEYRLQVCDLVRDYSFDGETRRALTPSEPNGA